MVLIGVGQNTGEKEQQRSCTIIDISPQTAIITGILMVKNTNYKIKLSD